jgi:hypothetical protein
MSMTRGKPNILKNAEEEKSYFAHDVYSHSVKNVG